MRCYNILFLFLSFVTLSFASDTGLTDFTTESAQLESEVAWLNAESYSQTALKSNSENSKIPGSVTVITEKRIKESGARDLLEILETVPGISVFRGAYNARIQVRGVVRTASQDIMIMINGMSINNNYVGSGVWAYGQVNLDHVKRIEVVKGPASALYGANAFSAVINIITKKGDDIDGWKVSQSGGSFNSNSTSISFGKEFKNKLKLSTFLDHQKSEGFSARIESDFQTYLDSNPLMLPIPHPKASLTPTDKTDNSSESYHWGMSLAFENFFLDTMYTKTERAANVGIVDALTNEGLLKIDDWMIQSGYKFELVKNLTLTPTVYYHFNRMDNRLHLLPPGSTNFLTGALLPNGMLTDFRVDNERMGTDIRLDWDVTNNYKVILGYNYELTRQKNVEQEGGYFIGDDYYDTGAVPRESLFIQSTNRRFNAIYLENIIDITSKLRATLSGRYDHYSDFGGSLNPHLGLAWEYTEGYDVKLMYGRAFRAPSFYELYNNHPLVLGNSKLDPETIDSLELSFGTTPFEDFTFRTTFFHNIISDQIVEDTNYQFQNNDETVINGVEFDATYTLNRGSYLTANYTYQHSYDKSLEARVGKIPLNLFNIASNFRLTRQINWYTALNWQDRPNPRSADSFKQYGESFYMVNSGFIFKNFMDDVLTGVEARFFIYNLFDKDAAQDYSNALPGGAPLPGRSYMFEVSLEF